MEATAREAKKTELELRLRDLGERDSFLSEQKRQLSLDLGNAEKTCREKEKVFSHSFRFTRTP